MYLDPKGSCGVPNVLQGSDRSLPFTLLGAEGDPLDLTNCTEVVIGLKKADGTVLSKKLTTFGVTMVNAVAGKILLVLTPTDTNAMATGLMDVEIKLTISSKISIVQISKAFNVTPEFYTGLN
jgi:hypothetical protein